MILRQSTLKIWMLCPLQAKFRTIERLPSRQNAKASFGSIIHYCLEAYNQGTEIDTCIQIFKDFWAEPDRLGVKPDYWPKYTSYGSLREKGIEILQLYHDKNKWENRQVLASEHSFLVPFGDHQLQGSVDHVEVKKAGNGRRTLRIVDFKTTSKAPTIVQLRLDQQFTVYIYASLQKEFWVGNGAEYPGIVDGERLYEELQDVPRRGVWYHLMTNKELNAGPRDDGDFMRLYRSACEIQKAVERDVYVPSISGESCTWCFAGETRILTRDGAKEIGSLVGQSPEVMTTFGKWVSAPVRSFGISSLQKLTLSRCGTTKVVYATPNHRWFVKGWDRKLVIETQDLKVGSKLVSTWGQNVTVKTHPSAYGIAHGLVFGDGNLVRRGAQGSAITLYGPKNTALLKWFPLSPCLAVGDDSLLVTDLPSYFKAVPSVRESKSYLYGFLAGYFAADGAVSPAGQVTLSSAKRNHLQLVRDICTRLGIGTYGITYEMRLGRGPVETPLYRVCLFRQHLTEEFFLIDAHRRRWLETVNRTTEFSWHVVSVETSNRSEEVFCASVPGTHAFVLEDNILTGNCDYTVNCGIDIPPHDEIDEDGL